MDAPDVLALVLGVSVMPYIAHAIESQPSEVRVQSYRESAGLCAEVSEAEPDKSATRAVQARVAVVQDRTPNHTGEPQ